MTPAVHNSPAPDARHVPVLMPEVLAWLSPREGGLYVDGTFGAGGYTRAILQAAPCQVIAIDRDPVALAIGRSLEQQFAPRLAVAEGRFADMEALVQAHGHDKVDGVVLDIGVSSMQLDDGARGFSFMKDGPLDMRMSSAGPTAAEAVARLEQGALADLIFILGEEPKARGIARAIVKARSEQPIESTLQLVRAIERATGPHRPHMRTHPATRTFQALRIFVNGELDQLAQALAAAERLLRPGGRLVVVTFHSLEDRIVKQFFAQRSGHSAGPSRHAPVAQATRAPSFTLPFKGHVGPGEAESHANPRARSAKLRAGVRTDADSWPFDAAAISVPALPERRH